MLHAVRDHRAQGRHWANLTGLYGHFSRAFGISKLDDFKAAGSKAEWREVCRAVEHNNTLYVPAADCDYQVKSAHKLLTLLREYKTATRIVVLEQHDPAEFLAYKRDTAANEISAQIVSFRNGVLGALDTMSTCRATADYRAVLGQRLVEIERGPSSRQGDQKTTLVVDTRSALPIISYAVQIRGR